METGNPFAHPEHQLFLSHADEDDGRLCNISQEPVCAGPTFSCVEGCRFYLHQRCADLPEQINHPCHDHPLQFNSGGSYACNVCKKGSQLSRYRCDACDFDVDLACSKLELKPLVRFEDGEHLFFLFRDIKFEKEYNCDVCRWRCDKDLPVMSCVCRGYEGHQRHVHCTPIELPSEVRHDRDIHPLVLKARLVGNHTGEYFCLVCGRTMRAHRPAYCCEMCNHIAHVTCLALEVRVSSSKQRLSR